jgi:hypothetical protein
MPQLALLDARSTHDPLHIVAPPGHEAVQAPLTHACPVAHALPHMPQFWPSVIVLVHVPLHAV